MLFHFHMVLVQPELLVAPAGGGFEVAILELEFLRLLPHDAGRDRHRDLLRLAALVARRLSNNARASALLLYFTRDAYDPSTSPQVSCSMILAIVGARGFTSSQETGY